MRQDRFAKKSLGQNFLTSTAVRDGILAEAGDLTDKQVLEIGPGLGFLTEKLLAAGAHVTAVELDNRAVKILNNKFAQKNNFTLIHGDILQQDLEALFNRKPYCVVANIPYNITNPILRKLTEGTKHQPDFALLMVQKEVAQKICAPTSPLPLGGAGGGSAESGNFHSPPAEDGLPAERSSRSRAPEENTAISKILSIPLQGQVTAPTRHSSLTTRHSPRRSILSIAVEVYAEVKYCFTVDREHFEPSPKVDSAIIRLDMRAQPLVPKDLQRDFFTVVNAGFSEKRKKIGNVLGKFFGLPSNQLLGNIDGHRRAETLSIEEWVEVTKNFQAQE